jgi:uncharacterized protein
MKWTTAQLIKQSKIDPTFEFECDLNSFNNLDDIRSVDKVFVTGDFEVIDHHSFDFYLEVHVEMVCLSSISLKPVSFVMDLEINEIFSSTPGDDVILIDGITIDLCPVIWSNIILEKPMRIVGPDEQFEEDSESVPNNFSTLIEKKE